MFIPVLQINKLGTDLSDCPELAQAVGGRAEI